MFKALLKKQFLELNKFYFVNRKTGKSRGKAGTAVIIALYVLLFIGIGAAVVGLAYMVGDVLLKTELRWMYFALMGFMAILMGVFGSVFNTYAGLYLAKDNELLLSMPIPPMQLLLARMVGVYAMSLLYSAMIWIPAIIGYLIIGPVSIAALCFQLLLLLILALLVTVFTCLLGWLVAQLSRFTKGRSFLTVIISLLFFAAYYWCCFHYMNMIAALLANIDQIASAVRTWLFPMYQLGMAACGAPLALLVFTAISGALFALCLYVLSRNFMKIALTKNTVQRTERNAAPMKATSVKKALLIRELRHFSSCSIWMLNGGLGIILLPAAAVLMLFKAPPLLELLQLFAPEYMVLVPVAALAIVVMIISMDAISASSVSLEGKNLWILQSMPVSTRDVLHAKVQLHTVLNLPSALISTLILGIALKLSVEELILACFAVAIFIPLWGTVGLALNLKFPNLTWTTETVPVKQSLPVCICLFGGWILAVAVAGIFFLLRDLVSPSSYLLGTAIVFLLLYRLLGLWLDRRGAAIFEAL